MHLSERILDDFVQRQRMGETEIFVKLLGFNDGKISAEDELIEQNRTFIGGKTRAQWLNPSDQQYIPFAYENLGRYYLKHACFDRARLCYHEILQGEINVDVVITSFCFESMASICERTGEYGEAMVWWKKVIDLELNGKYISTFESPTLRLFPKMLSIFADSQEAINYMKEIVEILLSRTDRIDQISAFIATIYKITISHYRHHDQSNIECICNHIHCVLDLLTITGWGWVQWLCIGATCNLETLKNHHIPCNPIIDENRHVYAKLYKKILEILPRDTSKDFPNRISQCERSLLLLR